MDSQEKCFSIKMNYFLSQKAKTKSFLGLFKHGVGQGDILNANDFFQTNLFRATQTNS